MHPIASCDSNDYILAGLPGLQLCFTAPPVDDFEMNCKVKHIMQFGSSIQWCWNEISTAGAKASWKLEGLRRGVVLGRSGNSLQTS